MEPRQQKQRSLAAIAARVGTILLLLVASAAYQVYRGETGRSNYLPHAVRYYLASRELRGAKSTQWVAFRLRAYTRVASLDGHDFPEAWSYLCDFYSKNQAGAAAKFACEQSMKASGPRPQSKQTMDDPLFGIAYDPQLVHFEDAPASISLMCAGLGDRKLWVYARWDTTDRQYFIVSGFMRFWPDGPGQPGTEPDLGTAVALDAGKCAEDNPEWFLWGDNRPAGAGPPIKASEDVLVHLSRDALERYAKAFGGKANFVKQLSPSDREALPPVLRGQLEQFEKEE